MPWAFVLVKEAVLENKFDIFTISETWLNSSVTDLEIEIPGYVVHRIDRQAKNGGEYVFMFYEIIGRSTRVTFLISRPLSSTNYGLRSTLATWSLSLSAQPIDHLTLPYLISIQISQRTLLMPRRLMCQFIYWLENSNNPEAKALINFCRSYNLSILITTPTQVTETSKSIQDAILASDTKQVQMATVMENSISDNDLVYVTLPLNKARSNPVYITTRSFKRPCA